jgi:glycyl-tRNA synthetase beta chain
MNQDVLFELGTEELPSGLVESLAKELLNKVKVAFDDVHMYYGQTQYFASPRRIAFIMENVGDVLPNRHVTKRGPQEKAGHDQHGNPTPALLGFARSCGVDVSQLKLVAQEKGAWWEYSYEEAVESLTEFLPQVIANALQTLPITKPMRWGNGEISFARPLHWAVLIYGTQVIEGHFLGVKASNLTYGHRFMHPQAIQLKSAKAYESTLSNAYVKADFAKRRADIIQQIETLAHQKQWYIPLPHDLIDEITSIVEWPVAMVGAFDECFLQVPEPVLKASMQGHQKCLPVYDKSYRLLPYFVNIANIVSKQPQSVQHGNEKVMRARLSDAMFFYQQDRREPLIQYAPMTEKVIFEERLGSLADKSQRVLKQALEIGRHFNVDESLITRAVELSKCDLMTGLVGEFPELQGLIGQFYAQGDGEHPQIVAAMFEQYLPRFSGDDLPKSDIGYLISLADRLDTLVGIFAIGLKPTGEKDPYKLRRHAQAVVRLLLQRQNQLNVDDLLNQAALGFNFLNLKPELLPEVKQFIIERMQSLFLAQDYSIECFNQALAAQNNCWYDLSKRMASYAKFMQSEQSVVLNQAAKRVKQILPETVGQIDHALLQESSEQELLSVAQKIESELHYHVTHQQYDEAFTVLLKLALPLASFFEQVFVMSDDLAVRQNRMALLAYIQKLLHSIVIIGL